MKRDDLGLGTSEIGADRAVAQALDEQPMLDRGVRARLPVVDGDRGDLGLIREPGCRDVVILAPLAKGFVPRGVDGHETRTSHATKLSQTKLVCKQIPPRKLSQFSGSPRTIRFVAEIRDVPLTEFTKKLLRDYQRGGGKLNAIEQNFDVPKGFTSTVLGGGSGVAELNARRFARAFGYTRTDPTTGAVVGDGIAYRSAAMAWWDAEGRELYEKTRGNIEDPELRKAVNAARATGGVPDDVIAATLEEFKGVSGKPWFWWTQQLGEAAEKYRARIGETKAEKKGRATQRRRERKEEIEQLPLVARAREKEREKQHEAGVAHTETTKARKKAADDRRRRKRVKAV